MTSMTGEKLEPIHLILGILSPVAIPVLLVVALLCRVGEFVIRIGGWAIRAQV